MSAKAMMRVWTPFVAEHFWIESKQCNVRTNHYCLFIVRTMGGMKLLRFSMNIHSSLVVTWSNSCQNSDGVLLSTALNWINCNRWFPTQWSNTVMAMATQVESCGSKTQEKRKHDSSLEHAKKFGILGHRLLILPTYLFALLCSLWKFRDRVFPFFIVLLTSRSPFDSANINPTRYKIHIVNGHVER